MGRYPKKRRRSFNLRRVRVTAVLAVGALATKDVISAGATGTVTSTIRVMSVKQTYTWSNIGASDDDSLEFGLAHSDYSAAEIEEALEATTSIDPGDKIAGERANRLVRSIGTISAALAGAAGGGAPYNNGLPKKTKLNWLLTEGDSLSIWVRNGSGTVYTTGSSLQTIGEMWVKDSA